MCPTVSISCGCAPARPVGSARPRMRFRSASAAGAPPAPTGLTTNVSGAQVALSWTASPDARATCWKLARPAAPPISAARRSTSPRSPPPRRMASTTCASGPPIAAAPAARRTKRSLPSASPRPDAAHSATPPAGTGSIFGIVDPTILGTCSAAAHDKWVVDGGDGFKYRTWHPQTDPSGCVYGHEHGDNPTMMQELRLRPRRCASATSAAVIRCRASPTATRKRTRASRCSSPTAAT